MAPPSYEVSPADRTVGQLVADTIRLYGERFFSSLILGLVVAVLDQLAIGYSRSSQAWLLAAASPFFTLAYIRACVLVTGLRPSTRAMVTALGLGVLIFPPVGILVWFFILPAVAWLALFGLAVPVALFENQGFRESLRRGRRLAAADLVHAIGGLATLVIVYGIARFALIVLLSGQAGAAARTALFLADLVLSPMLFLGSAFLYLDQKARLESGRPRRRRRDARLHHAVEPDRAGGADAQVEPRSPARGEP